MSEGTLPEELIVSSDSLYNMILVLPTSNGVVKKAARAPVKTETN